ncbi:MAG: iron-sulfur cluster repair di-iron protein [Bacteroidia bacterium]
MLNEKTIGEIVAEDYRTAEIFKSYGIDFCCKGNRTLNEACEKENLDKVQILQAIEKLGKETNNKITGYNSWPIDLLADYIEKTHHRYVEEKTPVIKEYLDKICLVHGKEHPELLEIRELFFQSAIELAAHIKKEELIVFPFVRKVALAEKDNTHLNVPFFGTLENPVNRMKDEHESEGEIFRKIAELSNNFTPPADACNTYKVTYAILKEFVTDLHTHIHLENNILFPKAISKEKSIGLTEKSS